MKLSPSFSVSLISAIISGFSAYGRFRNCQPGKKEDSVASGFLWNFLDHTVSVLHVEYNKNLENEKMITFLMVVTEAVNQNSLPEVLHRSPE